MRQLHAVHKAGTDALFWYASGGAILECRRALGQMNSCGSSLARRRRGFDKKRRERGSDEPSSDHDRPDGGVGGASATTTEPGDLEPPPDHPGAREPTRTRQPSRQSPRSRDLHLPQTHSSPPLPACPQVPRGSLERKATRVSRYAAKSPAMTTAHKSDHYPITPGLFHFFIKIFTRNDLKNSTVPVSGCGNLFY